jgi:hypothetical protein
MKSIPDPEEFPQKRAGKVIAYITMEIAHAGRRIQNQDKIDRFRRLAGN